MNGATGAPFAAFLGCGLTGTLGFGGTVEVDLHCAEIAFVDGKLGNNGMAVIGDICRPFQTIGAAIVAQVNAGNNLNSIFHALVYVKPWTYNETVTMRNNVDVYCEPGVVIRRTFVTGIPATSSAVYTFEELANWRWYGKAIFDTIRWVLFVGNNSNRGGGENIYFEFLEAGRINNTTPPTLFGGQIIARPAGVNDVVGKITIRGDKFISSSYDGVGVSIRGNRTGLRGRGYETDIYIKNSISAYHQCIDLSDMAGDLVNGELVPLNCIARCPSITVYEGKGATVVLNSSNKIAINSNQCNLNLRVYGNLYNLDPGPYPNVGTVGDLQGTVTILNNRGTVPPIGTTYPYQLVTINGNIDGGALRSIFASNTNRNIAGKLIVNGNVINNSDSIYSAVNIGWNDLTENPGEYYNVIINNGYIQGGGGIGNGLGGAGIIHQYNRTKLWLNNCLIQSQKMSNPGIYVEGDGNNELYMYNCVGEVVGYTGAIGYTGPTGIDGNFVYMSAGSTIDALGIINTKANTSVGGPGVIPADVWGGYSVIPSLIVPDIS